MKNNIFEDMYSGYMQVLNESYSQSSDYKEAADKLSQAEDELRKRFPECKPLLERYQDAYISLNEVALYNNFDIGFRAGAQIMLEVLRPNDTEG